MTSQVWVTDRIKRDLEGLAKREGVALEGLALRPAEARIERQALSEDSLELDEELRLQPRSAEPEKRGW